VLGAAATSCNYKSDNNGVTVKQNPCAVPRFHRAFRARKSFLIHHQARQTRVPREKCYTAFTPKLSVYAYQ